jgi:S-DNA-T family DNA segregation ATPase FtsK/SpoIIIE
MLKDKIEDYKELFKGEVVSFVFGLVLLGVAIYLLLAFTSFFFTGGVDQSLIESIQRGAVVNASDFQNTVGELGAITSNFFINECFGVASYIICIFIIVAGLKLMGIRPFSLWKWFVVGSLLMVWCSIFMAMITASPQTTDSFICWGGLHGYNVSCWLVDHIGQAGVWIILLLCAIFFLIYLSKQTIDFIRSLFSLKVLRHKKELTETSEVPTEEPTPSQPVVNESEEVVDIPSEEEEEIPEMEVTKGESDMVTPSNNIVLEYENTNHNGEEEEGEEDDDNYAPVEKEPYDPRLDLAHYRFPTIDLMKYYDSEPTINKQEQEENKDKIIKTLRSFGIGISSIKATVGPTVTLYEITPQEGIRISKIRGLENDLALSLSAMGIRIIAPIPGKGTIGIEVPNSEPKIVSGQSIIGSKKFQESTYDLPIALGKTITNEVFMVDLCKMPHILVAGATGQGKSVGLNTIISCLLYKKHPAELKFVLVDPKMVEFSIYSVLEHHYLAELPDGGAPIITDVTKVVQTLKSLCVEMDNRYTLLMKAHVRTIKEYNTKFINRRLNPEKGHHFLPYIVVVIDEYGDLIMTAGKDIELPIARIAQKARAVGIHMIIATQRPTTNIITGTIKANFPARLAFRVTTAIDSRTILDRTGANQLIGRGDMLFLTGADPVRVQCAFIDTPEIERITQFISEQQGFSTPYYLPEYVDENEQKGEVGEIDMDKLDPLFEKAAHLMVTIQQGSTSKIQREFSIGYNRAGRIMDQLEKAGIVGPSEGSKAREVLFKDSLMLDEFLKSYM